MKTKSRDFPLMSALALLAMLLSKDPARAQEPAQPEMPSPKSDVFVGLRGSVVFQAPHGSYATDHGNAGAFGFSLQLPIRKTKEWNFLPTYTTVTSTPGPSSEQVGTFGMAATLVELEHKTTSYGLDVQWRSREPGPAYLLFGAGTAHVTLDRTRTKCVLFSCSDAGSTSLGSKTAPYVQVGFGIDGGPSGGAFDAGLFLEVRAWWGPYLQPNFATDGTPAPARAKTGNAIVASLGLQMQAWPK